MRKDFEPLKEALVGLYEKLFQAIWHDAPNLGKISVLVCVVRLVHLLAKKAKPGERTKGRKIAGAFNFLPIAVAISSLHLLLLLVLFFLSLPL